MIGLVALLVVLAIGGLVGLLVLGRNSSSNDSSSSVATSPAPPPFVPGVPGTEPGSGGPPASQPSGGSVERPEVADGFKLVADDDKGFAFVMPKSWVSTDITREAIEARADALRKSNPELASALDQYKEIAVNGGLAFAFGPSDPSAPPGSPNSTRTLQLLAVPAPGLTVEQVAAQAELGLGALNGRILDKKSLDIADRKAVRVTVEIELPQGKATQTQVYLQGDGKIYVLSLSGVDEATANTIIQSVRVR